MPARSPSHTICTNAPARSDSHITCTDVQLRVLPARLASHLTCTHASGVSACRFWFYGDDPIDERLRRMAEYLDQYEPRTDIESLVPPQPLFTAPKQVVGYYAAGADAEVRSLPGSPSLVTCSPRFVNSSRCLLMKCGRVRCRCHAISVLLLCVHRVLRIWRWKQPVNCCRYHGADLAPSVHAHSSVHAASVHTVHSLQEPGTIP